MQIIVQKGSKLQAAPVTVDDVTFVVFLDDNGNPVGLAEQVGNDVIQFTTCKDKSFGLILRGLGIQATIPNVEVKYK